MPFKDETNKTFNGLRASFEIARRLPIFQIMLKCASNRQKLGSMGHKTLWNGMEWSREQILLGARGERGVPLMCRRRWESVTGKVKSEGAGSNQQ